MKKLDVFRVLLFVAVLLSNGCSKSPSSEDQLINAAANGNISEIQKLLSSGVSINCKSPSSGATPLFWAVWERRPEAVEVLLKAGANPNIPNATGKTPLFMAIGAQGEDTSRIIKALIAGGAEIGDCRHIFESFSKDNPNRTAFDEAVTEKLQSAKGSKASN